MDDEEAQFLLEDEEEKPKKVNGVGKPASQLPCFIFKHNGLGGDVRSLKKKGAKKRIAYFCGWLA